MPEGPTKMAKTLEEIRPVMIFMKTLILFKEVALNNGVRNMAL
jgi:hypothetical protein